MMETAKLFGAMSYCKRKQVGAVLSTDKGRILATGYNGTLAGLDNNCEDANNITSDLVLHAEQNIVVWCAENGVSMKDTVMYITISPCQHCAKLIAGAGVKKVVYGDIYKNGDGLDFLKRVGIEVKQILK